MTWVQMFEILSFWLLSYTFVVVVSNVITRIRQVFTWGWCHETEDGVHQITYHKPAKLLRCMSCKLSYWDVSQDLPKHER